MTVYNYVKPHWRNGPHAVHDVPSRALPCIERLLASCSRSASSDFIRVERDSVVGLHVAWIRCTVSLYTEDEASSYRRARYAHAIAMRGEDAPRLDTALAQRLFQEAYGTAIVAGVGAQQRSFGRMVYPDDRDMATKLFVNGSQLRRVGLPAPGGRPEPSSAPPTSLRSLLRSRGPG